MVYRKRRCRKREQEEGVGGESGPGYLHISCFFLLKYDDNVNIKVTLPLRVVICSFVCLYPLLSLSLTHIPPQSLVRPSPNHICLSPSPCISRRNPPTRCKQCTPVQLTISKLTPHPRTGRWAVSELNKTRREAESWKIMSRHVKRC